MKFNIVGVSTTEFYIYANVVASDTGVSDTPLNSNRNSSNKSSISVKVNPTNVATTTATLLEKYKFGAQTNKVQIDGSSSNEGEMILKSGKKYLYHIKSLADNNHVSYRGMWYEATS